MSFDVIRSRKYVSSGIAALVAFLLAVLLVVVPSYADDAACPLEGSGTSGDPYLIQSESDLVSMRDMVNGDSRSYSTPGTYDNKYFLLTKDLELTDTFNGSNTPIGATSATAFCAHFDGAGHTISNLSFTSSDKYLGLFGYIGGTNAKNEVSISNLGVTGTISGTASAYAIGGIVGYAGSNSSYTDRIEKCCSDVTITGNYALGGIVGSAGSNITIENCLAKGSITGVDNGASNPNKQMGGIVGYCMGTSKGSITSCLYTGQLAPTYAAMASSTIKTLNQTVNGIAGYISGTSVQYPLTRCLYVTQPSGVLSYHCGADGILGISDESRIVDTSVDGFTWDSAVATLNGGSTLETSTWQVKNGEPCLIWQLGEEAATFEVVFDPTPGAFGSTVETDTLGRHIVEVKVGDKVTEPEDPSLEGNDFLGWYVDVDGDGAYSEGDTLFDATAVIEADTALVARFAEHVADTFIALGEEGAPAGTAADPFVISTEADLTRFAASVNGKMPINGVWTDTPSGAHDYAGQTVVLARDIELTKSFTPIGIGMNCQNAIATPTPFAGTFNGQGHVISGLRFTNTSNPSIDPNTHGYQWYSALFGAVKGATVINVVVELDPAATFTVNTLAGEASAGLIAQVIGGETVLKCCGVKGDLEGGASHLGGLIGRVEGGTLTLSHCYHQGALVTASSGGGLIATVSAATVKIESCYQSGAVSSTNTSTYAANFFGQLAGSGSTVAFSGCVASEASSLGGANLTYTSAGCIAGVSAWNSSEVKTALGTTYFVYDENPAIPPEFGSIAKASYVLSFSKGSDVAGAVPTSTKLEVGTTYAIPSSSLTRKGYDFAGWQASGDEEGSVYREGDTFTMPEGNVELVAVWTVSEPTLISSEAELRAFAADVNAGALDTNNKRYALTCDINLSGTWTPIGNDKHPFEGIFDGQGHVVYNMSVVDDSLSQATSDRAFAGFFGNVDGADITNLGVEGSVTTTTATYAGGLVGLASGGAAVGNVPEDMTHISSCFVRVTLTAPGKLGGLIGQATRTSVTDCYASGDITLAATGSLVGGLVGYYQSASFADTTSVAIARSYSVAAVHTLNPDAQAGSLFGNVSEDYAGVATGGTWSRAENVHALESGLPAYYTESYTSGITKLEDRYEATYEMGEDAMRDVSFVSTLGSAYKSDAASEALHINGGYPVLAWEKVAEGLRVLTFAIDPVSASFTLTNDTTGAVVEPSATEQGKATYVVNPLYRYTFTAEAEGYTSQTVAIEPAATDLNTTVTLAPITYHITYTLYGGAWESGFTPVTTYTVEDELVLPTAEALSKDGYEFAGWKTALDSEGFVTSIPRGTTGDLTLIAWWQAEPEAPITIAATPYIGTDTTGMYLVTYVGEVPEGKYPVAQNTPFYFNGTDYVVLMTKDAASALRYKDFTLAEGEAPQATSFDLNGNGVVNIVDVQVAYDIARGVYKPFEAIGMGSWLSADANHDGTLDLQDVLMMREDLDNA